MGANDSDRAPDGFAAFLGSAAELGARVGFDTPLMSMMPREASIPFDSEKGAYDQTVKAPVQKFRVKRFRIGPEEAECDALNDLLDKISNNDNWFLRNQREQIMNDGSIVVLLSYMIVEMVEKKKLKLASEEEAQAEADAEAEGDQNEASPPDKGEEAPEVGATDDDAPAASD